MAILILGDLWDGPCVLNDLDSFYFLSPFIMLCFGSLLSILLAIPIQVNPKRSVRSFSK